MVLPVHPDTRPEPGSGSAKQWRSQRGDLDFSNRSLLVERNFTGGPTSDRSSANRLHRADDLQPHPSVPPAHPTGPDTESEADAKRVTPREINGGAWTRTTDLGIMRPSL
jgi:hypothetical protein